VSASVTNSANDTARPGVTFSPTYNVAGTVNEQSLAQQTVSRLLFAMNNGTT